MTEGELAIIWLGAGSGNDARYIWLLIDATTGRVEVNRCTEYPPPGWLLP
jgi:hypothetical protein